jgi:hypothetical protein
MRTEVSLRHLWKVRAGEIRQLLLHHRYNKNSFPAVTAHGYSKSRIFQLLLHSRYNKNSISSCYSITGTVGKASIDVIASQVHLGQLPQPLLHQRTTRTASPAVTASLRTVSSSVSGTGTIITASSRVNGTVKVRTAFPAVTASQVQQ